MEKVTIIDEIIRDIGRTGEPWDAWDVVKTFGLTFNAADALLREACEAGDLEEDLGLFYLPEMRADEYFGI